MARRTQKATVIQRRRTTRRLPRSSVVRSHSVWFDPKNYKLLLIILSISSGAFLLNLSYFASLAFFAAVIPASHFLSQKMDNDNLNLWLPIKDFMSEHKFSTFVLLLGLGNPLQLFLHAIAAFLVEWKFPEKLEGAERTIKSFMNWDIDIQGKLNSLFNYARQNPGKMLSMMVGAGMMGVFYYAYMIELGLDVAITLRDFALSGWGLAYENALAGTPIMSTLGGLAINAGLWLSSCLFIIIPPISALALGSWINLRLWEGAKSLGNYLLNTLWHRSPNRSAAISVPAVHSAPASAPLSNPAPAVVFTAKRRGRPPRKNNISTTANRVSPRV